MPDKATAAGSYRGSSRGIGDDDHAILSHRNGKDVVPFQRAHRQVDQTGHFARRTRRPDHAGGVINQRDHRQVVTQLGAKSQNRIERLVDIVGVQLRGRNVEKGIEQVTDGFQVARPFGDPALKGRVRARKVLGHLVERGAQGTDFVR